MVFRFPRFSERALRIRHTQRDHRIQALSPNCPNHTLAKTIGVGAGPGDFKLETSALDFFIQTGGKRLVAIMEQKLVILISV